MVVVMGGGAMVNPAPRRSTALSGVLLGCLVGQFGCGSAADSSAGQVDFAQYDKCTAGGAWIRVFGYTYAPDLVAAALAQGTAVPAAFEAALRGSAIVSSESTGCAAGADSGPPAGAFELNEPVNTTLRLLASDASGYPTLTGEGVPTGATALSGVAAYVLLRGGQGPSSVAAVATAAGVTEAQLIATGGCVIELYDQFLPATAVQVADVQLHVVDAGVSVYALSATAQGAVIATAGDSSTSGRFFVWAGQNQTARDLRFGATGQHADAGKLWGDSLCRIRPGTVSVVALHAPTP